MGLKETVKDWTEKGIIPANASQKQVLVALHQKGELTTPAVRSLATMLDEKIAAGVKNPLGTVLKAYDDGKVKLKSEGTKEEQTPTLKDVPANASPKQKILYLFKNGSISESTSRKAARELDRQQEDGEDFDVALALHVAGATHLLPPKVQDALKAADGEEGSAATEDTGDGADEGESGDSGGESGDSDEDGSQSSSEKLAELVYGSTVADLEPKIRAMTDVEKLADLKTVEQANPSHEGGRKGVLDVIEERIGELATDSTEE